MGGSIQNGRVAVWMKNSASNRCKITKARMCCGDTYMVEGNGSWHSCNKQSGPATRNFIYMDAVNHEVSGYKVTNRNYYQVGV